MPVYRESSQRKTIINHLSQRWDHPTAAAIYSGLRREHPHISLGTVYRNLEILEQQGRLRCLHLDPREARYEAHLEPHAHFYCRQCGRVEDIPLLEKNCCRLPAHLQEAGYRIERSYIDLIGQCPACKGQDPESMAGGKA
ncbi:MAG: transcriptional repressor [candidate division FCPU426 bacterium]